MEQFGEWLKQKTNSKNDVAFVSGFVSVSCTVCIGAMALVGSFMSVDSLDNLSFVGSILIFCVGLNLIRDKKIRVANLLPSIIVAAIWGIWR